MKKSFIILILLSSYVFGQRADFFKEDITFRLDGISMNVEGYYWFSNPSGKPITSEIFYPFPYNAGETIDSIRIFNLSSEWETQFKREDKYGVSFALHIVPLDTALLQIKYHQKLNGDSAVYILKTTQGWGKALKSAEFKLITPDSFIIRNFTYPPDESYEIEKFNIYLWKRENFMPDQNMIFYF